MPLNGPTIWQPIADQLLKIWPSAILAGGAARDFVVQGDKLPPNDIDFFVEAGDTLDFELAFASLKDSFAKVRLINEQSILDDPTYDIGAEKDLTEDQQCVGVFEFVELRDLIKVNVIGKRPGAMTSFDALFRTFDHSLCDFAWRPGDEQPYRSPEADATVRTKKVYVRRPSDKTTQRLERLTARKPYRDFTWEGRVEREPFPWENKRKKEFDVLRLAMENRPVAVAQPARMIWHDDAVNIQGWRIER